MLPRRRFLRNATLAALAFPALVRGQNLNSRLQLVQVGCGGKGAEDIRQASSHPKVRYVGFCDVDAAAFGMAAPGAPRFSDYRVMFDRLGDGFDAAVISTPDHMHALPALRAIRLRKHVYLQKPLAHDLGEVRELRLAAERAGVRTQMGIQNHSSSVYRTAVALARSGRIGKVLSVHVWQSSRGNQWTGRKERPAPAAPPANLAWDLWLGGAEARPYAPGVYHPLHWRDWKDFGGGALGDFGCHMLDPIFSALGLGAPISVIAESSGLHPETWSASQTVRYTFPGTPLTAGPTIAVTWYDGGRQPDVALARLPSGMSLPRDGSLMVGELGVILLPQVSPPLLFPVETFGVALSPGDAARRRRLLASGEKDDRKVAEIEAVPGRNHYHDWVDAALGGPETTANFAYAAPLTEAVLLGNLAALFPGEELRWDAPGLRVTNHAGAQALVRRSWRDGWTA